MIEVLRQLYKGLERAKLFPDRIYSWLIKADETEAQILQFCHSNLCRAERSESEYRSAHGHEPLVETTRRLIGGYYSLKETDRRGEYIYTARFEYIEPINLYLFHIYERVKKKEI